MQTPIENADDLASQTKISYGLQRGGSTENFFRVRRRGKMSLIDLIYRAVIRNRRLLLTNECGITYLRIKQRSARLRVRKESIEYWPVIMLFSSSMPTLSYVYSPCITSSRSTTSEYNIMRNCELTSIGGLLDSKGYGFGVPQSEFLVFGEATSDFVRSLDSPYRDILSDTILKLQDEGVIQKYYNKWWKEAANVKCDQEDKRKDLAAELGFANIGGVFVILAVGLVLSMIVAAVEFTVKIRHRKGREVKYQRGRDTFSCSQPLAHWKKNLTVALLRSLSAKKWLDTSVSHYPTSVLLAGERTNLARIVHHLAPSNRMMYRESLDLLNKTLLLILSLEEIDRKRKEKGILTGWYTQKIIEVQIREMNTFEWETNIDIRSTMTCARYTVVLLSLPFG